MEEQPLQDNWQTVHVDGKTMFKVPENLTFINKVGTSAFGIVACFSKPDGSKINVKKITDAFQDIDDSKTIVQDIRLMRKLKHPSLLAIQDMYPPDSPTFSDIYLVWEKMDTDLHRVIYSKQQLTEEHHQYFCCQILCGLRYLHAAKVVHYDLKPRNLLVNRNCDLRICEFTKARGVGPNLVDNFSEHVVCRWYWAPERILFNSECSPSIDIWSVGCILCELIGRKPAFIGKDAVDQVRKILGTVGSPSEADLDWFPVKSAARRFMSKIGKLPKQPWSAVYPQVGASAHEALEAMLTFHPHHRIDAIAALELPYFETLHEHGHVVVTCDDSDSKHVRCTTLGGDLIGTFPVPDGEQALYSWLAKKVVESTADVEGTLSLVNTAGELFCSRYLEEGSEHIEEALEWISDRDKLKPLQTEVYRECWKLRPWIADRDKQQLQKIGISLHGNE